MMTGGVCIAKIPAHAAEVAIVRLCVCFLEVLHKPAKAHFIACDLVSRISSKPTRAANEWSPYLYHLSEQPFDSPKWLAVDSTMVLFTSKRYDPPTEMAEKRGKAGRGQLLGRHILGNANLWPKSDACPTERAGEGTTGRQVRPPVQGEHFELSTCLTSAAIEH